LGYFILPHPVNKFWQHQEVYSVINQNYVEPETDHRSRFRDTDTQVHSVWVHFSHMLCYVVANWRSVSQNKKLGCRKEAARCFVSLTISLSHSRLFEMILLRRAQVTI